MYVGIKRWLGYKVMVRRSTPHPHPPLLVRKSCYIKNKTNKPKKLNPPSRKTEWIRAHKIIKILVRLETSRSKHKIFTQNRHPRCYSYRREFSALLKSGKKEVPIESAISGRNKNINQYENNN